MSKRIYVGNLPWNVTKEGLEDLFSSFGEIEEALVIANKYTGRSRGFGFVTYKNDADADKAMKDMNEKDIEGRRLVVKLARPSREEGEFQEEEQKPEEKLAEEQKEETEEKPAKKLKKEKKQEPEEEQKPEEKLAEEQKPEEKLAEEQKEETEEKAPKETEEKPEKEKPEKEKEETEEK